jgi:hypothetical protein
LWLRFWQRKKIEKPPFHSFRTNFKSKCILIEWNCISLNNHALNKISIVTRIRILWKKEKNLTRA